MIKEFFEDYFNDTSGFFLYKDQQLLQENKFEEFAEEQIKKVNTIFWSFSFLTVMGIWYGTTHLIKYGSDPTWLNLSIGLGARLIVLSGLFFAVKEYYVVKSSMQLLLKILRSSERDTTG